MTKEQIEKANKEFASNIIVNNNMWFERGFEQGAERKENQFKSLLGELLSKQREVISSPIRFNGVSVSDIEEVFKSYGISIEIKF
jgi:hypothetical protein